VQGESLSAADDSVQPFKSVLGKIMEKKIIDTVYGI